MWDFGRTYIATMSVKEVVLSSLAGDVVDQYEMITGDRITLFLDEDKLDWGADWRDQLDNHLNSAGFFIPVMTPRYFLSAECRREFQAFAIGAKKLGVEELLLPIHYVSVPALLDDSTDDKLIQIARTYQWKDWRNLRFKNVDSEEYRSSVAEIASHLANANRHAEERQPTSEITETKSPVRIEKLSHSAELPDVTNESGETEKSIDGEEPERGEDGRLGTVDRMALAESELPKWRNTIIEISDRIREVGELFEVATHDIELGDGRGGFSARLKVAKRLAAQLSKPTAEISRLASHCISQTMNVDDGIRTIIQQMAKEIELNPDLKEECCRFISSIRETSETAKIGFKATDDMIKSITPIESMSRDLRPVVRQLRKALTKLSETRFVTEGWMTLISTSGVDCTEV